jgi:hypothetical protein
MGRRFAMQSEAADYMGTFTFNGIRFILGFLCPFAGHCRYG